MRFGRTEKQHIRKKQKTDLSTDSTTEMAFFAQSSTQFLSAPSAPFRRRPDRLPRQQDDIDEFLSSDLELSFASNVSLNSPPRDPIALTPESEYADAMDISPAPKSAFARPFVSDKPLPLGRPRAFTTAARIFGSDVSNKTASTTTLVAPTSADKADSSTQSSSKRIQRAALPLEWMTTRRASDATRPTEIPFLAVRDRTLYMADIAADILFVVSLHSKDRLHPPTMQWMLTLPSARRWHCHPLHLSPYLLRRPSQVSTHCSTILCPRGGRMSLLSGHSPRSVAQSHLNPLLTRRRRRLLG